MGRRLESDPIFREDAGTLGIGFGNQSGRLKHELTVDGYEIRRRARPAMVGRACLGRAAQKRHTGGTVRTRSRA